MAILIDFDENEKNRLTDYWKKFENIGTGSEATCYLVNGEVFKVYTHEPDLKVIDEVNTDNLNLESFLFPEEIYVCNNKIFAYKTRYISKDYFDMESLHFGITIDINKLKKAFIPFIKDVLVLSKNNIRLNDLTVNTMFDGERLYAIDTLSYKRCLLDQYNANIEFVKDIISFYKDSLDFYYKTDNPKIEQYKSQLEELIQYIEEIGEKEKIKYNNKNIQKIKSN